jgi:thymidylate synthase
MNVDEQYKILVKEILNNGIEKEDRTGVGTYSIFGHQMKFKMDESFPLLTLRKIHIPSLIHELLWFLESYDDKYKKFGNTNIKYLIDNGITFWSEWPYEEYKNLKFKNYLNDDLRKDKKTIKKLKILPKKEFEKKIKNDDNFAINWGDLGPVYGKQWTDWGGYIEKAELKKEYGHTKFNSKVVDHYGWKDIKIKGINQIENIINELKENPDSRRLIVNSWNVNDIDDMLLPPCHVMFQFYSFKDNNGDRKLSLQLYQRSIDIGLGSPYNIASYSLLLYMVSKLVNMIPHEFVYTLGDAHIYKNHISQLKNLIKRESKPLTTKIRIGDIKDIKDFRYNKNLFIDDYQYHPNIKMEVAV